METGTIVSFIVATIIFVAMPGPNVTLIIANSLDRGVKAGLLTVAGTNTGIAIHLVIVVLGAGSLLQFAASWFVWIKWLGIAYLVFLGIGMWRQPPERADRPDPLPRYRLGYWQGFVVALGNPKIMIFLAAFLPQFVDPGRPPAAQLLTLALTFLVVGAAIEAIWALVADRIGMMLRPSRPTITRFVGALYIATAAILAAFRRA